MFRVGFGKDIHRLVSGKPLILGGVKINFSYGLEGHSDADVVYHALTDAVLGALALGDIGTRFPNTDIKYKNCDSSLFVKEACRLMKEADYRIGNIDILIEAEEPVLRPYIQQMQLNIAKLFMTDATNVSLKAGTREKMDAVGKKQAIEATAVVLLEKE
ncbi:MAG TPA: 2-C-methyl-D-erythritol 2,4-cyclodiphosphate synthase [Bacilli bacterium]|nr:2-C-methyl-D-erythritol 2,4-cyclodiphosphate synthase [Bacilli bacterium]